MSFETTGPPCGRPLELHTHRQGHGPTIVLVHGFTQTSISWARVARELERDFEVVVPDLPGHGRSPIPDPCSGLEQASRALGEAGGEASYVGYSLGGRCCLHLALQAPHLVERLVIVGAHPGISDEPSRRLRRVEDDRCAAELERGGDATVPEFVETWLAGPLFSRLTEEQADRPSRLANSAAGLAASLRTVGTGTQTPLWDRLGELDMPVLVVVGALDDKFGPLAQRTVEAIGRNARLAVVDGAGHAVGFERPGAFAELVREFLAPSG
jgi:2-succinyl-6-hydroxy-2,4-cyclohexadiene-1-carboxylate synthase